MCTCINKVTGMPLKKYYSDSEAHEAVLYVKYTHDKEMEQYLCNKCGFWHLSPVSRATPSHKCIHCTGGNGMSKDTYHSKQDALVRSGIIYDERNIRLSVYPCPYEDGWHLTKG